MDKTKTIIGLLSGVIGLFFYKLGLDDDYKKKLKELESDKRYYLDLIDDLEGKVNPNSDEQMPFTIVPYVNISGGDLENIDIVLRITNNSTSLQELGDFRSTLTVGGYLFELVMPSNNKRISIAAGRTVDFHLYNGDDDPFPDDTAYEIIKALDPLKVPKVFDIDKYAAIMDIDFLWFWKGGNEEKHLFDVPCHLTMYGNFEMSDVGYNAGDEDDQEDNPSLWTKYDTHEDE